MRRADLIPEEHALRRTIGVELAGL